MTTLVCRVGYRSSYMRGALIALVVFMIASCAYAQKGSSAQSRSLDSGSNRTQADLSTVSADIVKTIQEDLIWSGEFNGMVDGIPGKRTRSAFHQWKGDEGYPADDSVTDDILLRLSINAAKLRSEIGWTQYRNTDVGYSISYPARIMSTGTELEYGGRLFESPDSKASLRVEVVAGAEISSIDSLYTHCRESIDTLSYTRSADSWFVVSGYRGNNCIYARGDLRAEGAVYFAAQIPNLDSKAVSIIAVAFANSFNVRESLRISSVKQRTLMERLGFAANAEHGQGVIVEDVSSDIAEKEALSASELYEHASTTVYTVYAFDMAHGKPDEDSVVQGSAVAIDEYALLTNKHVIENRDNILILNEFDEDSLRTARVSWTHDSADLSALAVEDALPSSATITNWDEVSIGETVYAIGTPSGLDLTLSRGLVSSKRESDDIRLIQTTAAISPGSSGGGLFNEYGELIGITTFYLEQTQSLNFAIAADEAAGMVTSHMNR